MTIKPSDYNLPLINWRPYQLETIQWVEDVTSGKAKITEQPTGCHAKGQGILMYDGSIKKVEDIAIGDTVMGDDWTIRNVVQLFRGKTQIYEVNLDDGFSFTATRDHVMVVVDFRPNYSHCYSAIEMTVGEFLENKQQDYFLAIRKPYKYSSDIRLSNISIRPLVGIDNYYGFMLDGNHRYLLDNFIVTRNSGKSALSMAQGSKERRVLVLTKTKSLQLQYANDNYDAKILFGKVNYPCLHKLLPLNATAEDCRHANDMQKCDLARTGNCDFYNARLQAQFADRVVFNYALWFATHEKWQPDYLIMDEAHNVSDMVLDHVGFELSEQTRTRYELPSLPDVTAPSQFVGRMQPREQLDLVLDWLGNVERLMDARISKLDLRRLTETEMKKLRIWRNYKRKAVVMQDALQKVQPEHWFMRSGLRGLNGQPGLLCKPITARYHTKQYFYHSNMMFMSATIGDVPTFAAELGLTDYEYRIVPSVWPAETRPVYVLPCPSMGKTATEKEPTAFEKQADVIAKAIKDCPNDWSGIILVTRKAEANLLAERLMKRGLGARIWVTPGWDEPAPTDQQITAWHKRLAEIPNTIGVAWSFWEGVNLVESKICIVAKAPYVAETEYERARRVYDPKMYLQRAAYILEQGLGRTRRGNAEDYDDVKNEIQRGLVCIADASWKRLQPYMSQAIKEAIIEL